MLKGVLAGLAAGALWGLVFVAPRLTPGLSPVDLVAGRFVSFGVISVLVMVLARSVHQRPTAGQALAALGMSVLGFSGYYLLLVLAIEGAGTEVPTLVIGTIPIWVMLLGKPRGLKWTALLPGLLLTAAGLLLMMRITFTTNPAALVPSGSHYGQGVAWAVAAVVCWTSFAVLNAAWLKRHPDVSATEWTNWLGIATGVGAVLLWLLAGSDVKALRALDNIGSSAMVCMATGVGSAWVAAIFWNIASRRLSVSLCGQLIISETLFALMYSFGLAGTWPGAPQLLAALLFTLGVLASIRAHR